MSSGSQVTIEIDGKKIEAPAGAMLIDVADENGYVIPRFCYHKKLSVAANCRMCLVDVEKAPKPLPACATPVADGMIVNTRSPRAIAAQKATMEFLLINHPLDCPICDQGGECELQDVAMGYGGDVSRYSEGKRVVKDKDIGPLIQTDLTRCIHCTRCVRFGQEIAGMRELGATGRGEKMLIGTYIQESVNSELSGNVIDLCPVGALTAKPSRYTARAWELGQHETIAPHDCVGSNLFVHSFRGETNRIVPKDNEAINECWISDRDRFSYKALTSQERLQKPMIKIDGQWQETDWQTALEKAFGYIQDTIRNYSPEQVGIFSSPNSTLEEMYLLRKFADGIKCPNIDFRLRQSDFTHQAQHPMMPTLGVKIADIEKAKSILLIGSNVRKEQPMIAHRIRKANKNGAKVFQVNHRAYDMNMTVSHSLTANYRDLVVTLAGVLKALSGHDTSSLPNPVKAVLSEAQVNTAHQQIADELKSNPESLVFIGNQAAASPYFSLLEALAREIAKATQSQFGYLTDGANACGGWLAGHVPHRGSAGEKRSTAGLHARAMLEQPRNLYILNNVEAEYDFADPMLALNSLTSADYVICLTPFVSSEMKTYADVMLPIAPYTENAGSYVNVEGVLQSFTGLKPLAGSEARPAWKVIRVLSNYFELNGFDYNSVSEVLSELSAQMGEISSSNDASISETLTLDEKQEVIYRCSEVNAYRSDNLVRRSAPLQETFEARDDAIRINQSTAQKFGVSKATQILAKHEGRVVSLALTIDDSVADNSAWVPAGMLSTRKLGPMFGLLDMEAD